MKKTLVGICIILILMLPSVIATSEVKSEENEILLKQNKASGEPDLIITNIFPYRVVTPGVFPTYGLKMTIKNIGDGSAGPGMEFEFNNDIYRFRFFSPPEHIDHIRYGLGGYDMELLPGETRDAELTFGEECYWSLYFGIFKVIGSFWCNRDNNPDNNEYTEYYKGTNFLGFSWTELPNFRPFKL